MDRLDEEQQSLIKKLYHRTLPGTVINYIKQHEEVSLEDLMSFVSKVYSSLRNTSGCKYKGKNMKKIVLGLLSASVFNVNSDYISLNSQLLDEYEKTRIDSIAIHRSRHKIKLDTTPESISGQTTQRILMIEDFCGKLANDPEFCSIFDDPFKKIKPDDRYEDAGTKVGFERLIGMIQGYELAKKYCNFYKDSEIDKKYLLEKYHSRIVIRSLNQIEKRIGKLEAIKDIVSDKSSV